MSDKITNDWNKVPRDLLIKTINLQNEAVAAGNKEISSLREKGGGGA